MDYECSEMSCINKFVIPPYICYIWNIANFQIKLERNIRILLKLIIETSSARHNQSVPCICDEHCC